MHMTSLFVDARNFIEFSIDIEQYLMHSNSFLDEHLLYLIKKNFGLTNSAITFYDKNKFSGAVSINAAQRLDGPYKDFCQKDLIAAYITNKISRSNLSNIEVVRATDVIPDYYDKSDYCSWMRENANIKYVAVSPVPFHDFRFCVYRSEEENDFSNIDLEVISSIVKIIASKYQTHKQIKDIQTINHLKNKFLDATSIGVILMNKDFVVIDCNQAAIQIINNSGKDSILSFFTDYIKRLSASVPTGTITVPECFNLPKDTSVHFSTHVNLDRFYILKKYYFITIKHKEASLIQKDNTFMQKFNLSQREIEIIKLLSRGLKYQNIADQLFISLNTVRTHIKNIYKKLGVDNQRALLYLYNKLL